MVKGRWNRQRLMGRSGQSIIEYLVIAGAIISVIVGLGAILKPKVQTMSDTAASSVDAASATLGGLVPAAH